jgi:hypothetical protein
MTNHHLPQLADKALAQKVSEDFCHGAVLINSSVDICIYFSGSGFNWPTIKGDGSHRDL